MAAKMPDNHPAACTENHCGPSAQSRAEPGPGAWREIGNAAGKLSKLARIERYGRWVVDAQAAGASKKASELGVTR